MFMFISWQFVYVCVRENAEIRGGADKSLAQPGRKEATVNKLGIFFNILPTKLNIFLSVLL